MTIEERARKIKELITALGLKTAASTGEGDPRAEKKANFNIDISVNVDTSTARIEVGGDVPRAEIKIPNGQASAPCAVREAESFEYDGEGAVRHVKISPWQTRFSFYSRFAAQAERLWRKKYKKTEYVDFFSYMPQYEQMTHAQLAYYLYFRDAVRHGEYPSAGYSYVLLYFYEIINLPHMVSPELGARLMARAWGAYRKEYPYLDKYAGEWLCDYCLINRTPPPYDIVSDFISDAAPNLKMPEFYLGEDESGRAALCSSYDYKKSKYYQSNKDVFDAHIPAAAKLGIEEYFRSDEYKNAEPSHLIRESYSGAVAKSAVKYKIEVWYSCASRNRAVRDVVARIFKQCENNVRAALGIRSWLKCSLPESVLGAVNGYFDVAFPSRMEKRKKDAEADEYMKLYEPQNTGRADIFRALELERNAWKTAAELEGNGDNAETDASPSADEGAFAGDVSEARGENTEATFDGEDGFAALVSAMRDELQKALEAAAFEDFPRACAEMKMTVTEAERLINELAFDIVGDAIMIDGKILEDYREDVETALIKRRRRE